MAADCDLRQLAELSVGAVLKIPADLGAMRFTVGQFVQLTIGRGNDGNCPHRGLR